jgi:hypothetical protein
LQKLATRTLQQVTNAANKALSLIGDAMGTVEQNDRTGPTIFAAWVMPENPGGKTWGEHGNTSASISASPAQATVNPC